MRTIARFTTLLLFLLSACNLPNRGQPASGITPVPVTDSPTQNDDYTQCGFVWARESLDGISEEFDKVLKETLPQADGRAEAYGENCLNNQGEVVRFLAMETDFHVTLQVKDLVDKNAMGVMIEQVLDVLSEFPTEATPGPQSGYVGITFEAPGDELRLWFPQLAAQDAIERGLRGEELFDILQAN